MHAAKPAVSTLGGMAALALAATAGHVAYPAALWWSTRRRDEAYPPAVSGPWPSVTVVVAAYLESAVIGAKVADCRANGYRGELQVLVAADDPGTAAAARDAGAEVVESAVRRGKSAALSDAFTASKGEVLVLTDANTSLEPGSIEALVRWFADPGIGAVAGEKRHSSGAQGVYWSFESWLKRREHRLGSTIGLVGECSAVRGSTAPRVPDWAVVDDLWLALAVIDGGGRIAYEPMAVATEAPAPAGEEWQRRTRIVAGAIQVLWRRRAQLDPRQGLVAFEIWGHRLWRMTGGPLANLALLALAVRRVRTPGVVGVASTTVVAVHVAGVAALAAGDRPPAALRALGQALYLQLVGLAGMARLARGNLTAAWPKPDRRPTT